MCTKCKVQCKLQAFVAMHTLVSHIHILKSNHRGKYVGDTIQEWMSHQGI
jgi:hypothetical protein